MKTREELSEGDLHCLEVYEQNSIISIPTYEIGKKIAESLKPKKWKPSKKRWSFLANCNKENIVGFNHSFERHCHTLREASRRLKMERELNTINAYILENKGAWVADWADKKQHKYFVVFNHYENKFDFEAIWGHRVLGVEYCSREIIIKLCQMLNDGLIEGVAKR